MLNASFFKGLGVRTEVPGLTSDSYLPSPFWSISRMVDLSRTLALNEGGAVKAVAVNSIVAEVVGVTGTSRYSRYRLMPFAASGTWALISIVPAPVPSMTSL